MNDININNVYIDADERQFRIIHINEGYAFVIYFNSTKNMPVSICIKDLVKSLENGVINKKDDQFLRIISDSSLKESDLEKRDRLFSIIYNTWNDHKDALVRKHSRTIVLKQIAIDCDISYSSVKRYFCRFLQRGLNRNSFLNDYYKCGTYDRKELIYTKKAGRPKSPNAIVNLPEGINVTEEHKDIIKTIALKKYPVLSRPFKTTLYNEMIELFFSDKEIGENSKIIPKVWSEDRLLSLDQFLYWFNIFSDPKRNIEGRYGEITYSKDYRAKTSNTVYDSEGPCHRFEIDATISDVYLLSSKFPGRVIGRPVLYFVVDVFSRLICGMYVGLEGPSWIGAAMALLNMVSNKKEFCKWNGRDIDEEVWPAQHFPDILLADNGELLSNNVADLESIYGLHMEHHASYRGDFKGTVERKFGKFNGVIKEIGTPGAVMKEFRERGANRPQLDAALTLEGYVQMIIDLIIETNQKTMKDYPYTKEMVISGVRTTPIELWNWGLNNKRGLVKKIDDLNQYKMALLPKDSATIASRGIVFKNVHYESKRFFEENWHLRKDKSLRIAYDPRIIDNIYVLESSDLTKYEIMDLCPPYVEYAGWSFAEYQYSRRLKKDRDKAANHKDLQLSVTFLNNGKQTNKDAQKKKSYLPQHSSKSEVLNGIDQNRKIESHYNRQAEAFRFNETSENGQVPCDEIEENKSERDNGRSSISLYGLLEEKENEETEI